MKEKTKFEKFLKRFNIGFHRFFKLEFKTVDDRINNFKENIGRIQSLFTSLLEHALQILKSMFNIKFFIFYIFAAVLYFRFKVNPLGFNPEHDLPLIYGLIGAIFFLWFSLYFFTNKRKLKEDIEFPMDHFKSVSWGLFNFQTNNILQDRFKVADIADAETTAEINIAAFSGSTWETTKDDKLKRNLGHIKKNPYAIVLIYSSSGEAIGFTHVLPVNRRIWNGYTAGKFTDNGFNEEYIVGEDFNPCYERPYGLIYFSAVIPFWDNNKNLSHDEIMKQKGILLEQCTAYHFDLFMKKMFPQKNRVKVLFNNFDDLLYQPFQKEAINEREMKNGEKAPIFIFEITNR